MRYISNNVISFSMRIKGRSDSVRVNFLPVSTGGSSYSTNSDSLVQALEKSPMYNKVYRRAPECINEVVGRKQSPKTASKAKNKAVSGIKTWQDAIEYLVSNFGSDVGKLVTPDEILNEANAKGVEFVDLR